MAHTHEFCAWCGKEISEDLLYAYWGHERNEILCEDCAGMETARYRYIQYDVDFGSDATWSICGAQDTGIIVELPVWSADFKGDWWKICERALHAAMILALPDVFYNGCSLYFEKNWISMGNNIPIYDHVSGCIEDDYGNEYDEDWLYLHGELRKEVS